MSGLCGIISEKEGGLQTEEKNKEEGLVSVWLVTLKLEGMTEWSHYSPSYNIEKEGSRRSRFEQRFAKA